MSTNTGIYIVTGATGGLGGAVVKALLETGDEVLALGRRESSLEKLRGRITEGSERLKTQTADVGDEASVAAVFEGQKDRTILGVAHLVGGYAGGPSIDETPLADLEKMIALNIRGCFLILREGTKALKAQGNKGGIVCIGSVSGRSGAAGHAPYAATKAAVHSLVRSAAVDMAAHEIRVNAVLPGMIATDANKRAMPDADHTTWVEPARIAETIRFLLAPGQITGACIEITGKSYQPD